VAVIVQARRDKHLNPYVMSHMLNIRGDLAQDLWNTSKRDFIKVKKFRCNVSEFYVHGFRLKD